MLSSCRLFCSGVRQQLAEQLKCLDQRLETHVALVGEVQEFCRRRAEVELEYSRAMDKLVRQITARHKTDKLKYILCCSGLALEAALYTTRSLSTLPIRSFVRRRGISAVTLVLAATMVAAEKPH